MRALIQRVDRASVYVEGENIGAVGRGLVIFLAVMTGDDEKTAHYIVDKLVNLRIFPGQDGRFDLSALECKADLLFVSQFTLYGDMKKGRRPSFIRAASPDKARVLFHDVVDLARKTELNVVSGRFQSNMMVEIHNDGPVTLMLDSED